MPGISEHASGTRTAGTPPEASYSYFNSSDDSTDGVFQLFVDCSNMQAADTIEIVLYEKILSSGSQRIIFTSYFTGIQDEPVFVSPAMVLMHGWAFGLKQLAGTARSYDWSIRKLG
jgi:hypothetical protein